IPLRTWINYRPAYLDELLRLEGRGTYITQTRCCTCNAPGVELHRCKDCLSFGEMLCAACMVNSHKAHPFHRIEVCTPLGTSWHSRTEASVGLEVHLGHTTATKCPFSSPGHAQFIALHVNGLHRIAIDFCGCPSSPPRHVQLLRASLYPATPH
ncbi:uncharacterized protein STEHIDRAFT_69003, partial [Stereum hirsutum FP-91666 SS1]